VGSVRNRKKTKKILRGRVAGILSLGSPVEQHGVIARRLSPRSPRAIARGRSAHFESWR
jgi:hypothetical protein